MCRPHLFTECMTTSLYQIVDVLLTHSSLRSSVNMMMKLAAQYDLPDSCRKTNACVQKTSNRVLTIGQSELLHNSLLHNSLESVPTTDIGNCSKHAHVRSAFMVLATICLIQLPRLCSASTMTQGNTVLTPTGRCLAIDSIKFSRYEIC